ncbi:hypothetical protein [Noviherbaspirillum autotrophicum]|uniref:Uncharacterized protein n=1 Tax=Noviherbaspirillum autotrophicum TaxID=709839 RepID=A0A0C2BJ24_9BURK|nr:hypothetical protein [Noviherbaspirillum autotrophicum]KIF79974.1 hypothetical protein TSA66_02705 [Noviherbaspirillum autotrophicum]
MPDSQFDQLGEDRRAAIKKVEAAGWGVFFIWIGIAFLANLSLGVGLFGIGIIMLGIQMGRRHFHLPIEGFGLVMGMLFVLAGLWNLLRIILGQEPIPHGLMPVLSIAVGIVLVVSAVLRKRH